MDKHYDFTRALIEAGDYYGKASVNDQKAYVFGRIAGLALRASMIFVTIPVTFPIFLVTGIIYIIFKSVRNGNRKKGDFIITEILRKMIIEDGILDLNEVAKHVPSVFFEDIILGLLKRDESFKKYQLDKKTLILSLKPE